MVPGAGRELFDLEQLEMRYGDGGSVSQTWVAIDPGFRSSNVHSKVLCLARPVVHRQIEIRAGRLSGRFIVATKTCILPQTPGRQRTGLKGRQGVRLAGCKLHYAATAAAGRAGLGRCLQLSARALQRDADPDAPAWQSGGRSDGT